ncbi:hypothetical protein Tco_1398981 [Tanacetum coccineum]
MLPHAIRNPLTPLKIEMVTSFGWMILIALLLFRDPTKVKVVERERKEDEPLLLQTIVGRTIPLLPVAPDYAKSDMEASVDTLFDEGESGD